MVYKIAKLDGTKQLNLMVPGGESLGLNFKNYKGVFKNADALKLAKEKKIPPKILAEGWAKKLNADGPVVKVEAPGFLILI